MTYHEPVSPYSNKAILEKTRIIQNWTHSFTVWSDGYFYGQIIFNGKHCDVDSVGPKRTKPEVIHSTYELVYDRIWGMVNK